MCKECAMKKIEALTDLVNGATRHRAFTTVLESFQSTSRTVEDFGNTPEVKARDKEAGDLLEADLRTYPGKELADALTYAQALQLTAECGVRSLRIAIEERFQESPEDVPEEIRPMLQERAAKREKMAMLSSIGVPGPVAELMAESGIGFDIIGKPGSAPSSRMPN